MIRIFNQLVSLKTLVLIQTEALLILSSFIAAAKLWFWNDPSGLAMHAPWPFFFCQCLIQIVLLQVCFYYSGLYDVQNARTRVQQLMGLVRAMGTLWLISAAVDFVAPAFAIGRGVTILALTLTLVGVFGARLAFDRLWLTATPTRDLLVLGTGAMAAALAQEIQRRDDLNLKISAFATPDAMTSAVGDEFLGRPVVRLCNLPQEAARLGVSQVVVATEKSAELPMADLVTLRLRGVRIDAAQELIEALSGRVRLDAIFPSDFILDVIVRDGLRRSRLTLIWKRSLDLFLGLMGLLVTAPVMALTALAIWLDSGRPILYRQARVGLSGEEFQLLKFRSMRVDAEPNGEPQWARSNDPRVTRVGAFLRAYRLDELPQFINVVRGEMSFVGPRPERPPFVTQLRSLIPYYEARHSVRPGVTGWAQVEYLYGRTIGDAVRKLEYDLFYLKNMSFAFDCVIALKTLRIVLLGWGNR